MPPIDKCQGLIVDRLKSVFDQDKMITAQPFQKRDLFLVNAARMGPDGEPHDTRVIEGLAIEPFKDIDEA